MVILDMEAGVEHLSRGTASAVDRLIVVVEPGRRSVDTAHTVLQLATDIGLSRVAIIANKVRGAKDEAFLREKMEGLEILGFIPYAEEIIESDMANQPPYQTFPELVNMMKKIIDHLIQNPGHGETR